jgi:flavin reductase (DIM6/NTAB) family NADH-FMN oxidoreductase RutF
MDVDPKDLSPREIYPLMTSCIIPRPVAWISTRSRAGALNLAPFSYFMGVGSRPPMVSVCIGKRAGRPKDTAQNIRDTRQFVVNIATCELAEKMVQCSGDYAPDIDEFEVAGLTPSPSVRVEPPGVAESPIRMECRLYEIIKPGDNPIDLILGEVVHFHLDDAIVKDGQADAALLDPISRLGHEEYAPLGNIFTLLRPSV